MVALYSAQDNVQRYHSTMLITMYNAPFCHDNILSSRLEVWLELTSSVMGCLFHVHIQYEAPTLISAFGASTRRIKRHTLIKR